VERQVAPKLLVVDHLLNLALAVCSQIDTQIRKQRHTEPLSTLLQHGRQQVTRQGTYRFSFLRRRSDRHRLYAQTLQVSARD
jgi:hypothetical protein